MIKFIVFFITLFCFVAVAIPALNQFPDHFSIQYLHINSKLGQSVGKYWYDYANKGQRWDYMNSAAQTDCNAIMPSQTTCTLLIHNTFEYYIFPQKRICCMCSQNAIFPKRDYMKSYYHFSKEINKDGELLYQWSNGLLSFYTTTSDDLQVPIELKNPGGEDYIYNRNSYNLNEIQNTIFKIPSYCSDQNICKQLNWCKKN